MQTWDLAISYKSMAVLLESFTGCAGLDKRRGTYINVGNAEYIRIRRLIASLQYAILGIPGWGQIIHLL
jgi:hypothetical protein